MGYFSLSQQEEYETPCPFTFEGHKEHTRSLVLVLGGYLATLYSTM